MKLWLGFLLIIAIGIGLAWLGTKYALVGGTVALVAFARLDRRGRALLAALLVPSALGYAWFHLATYGGLTPYTVNRLYTGSSTLELVGLHLELWNRLYRFVGLWADGEFGLLRWAPALALALPAAPFLVLLLNPLSVNEVGGPPIRVPVAAMLALLALVLAGLAGLGLARPSQSTAAAEASP